MEISLIGKRIHVPKLVGDWLEFDRAFSAKVMAGDWRNMRKEDLAYGASQLILAAAIAACGLTDRGSSKPPEQLAVQPSIGLINEDIAAGSPASLKKLNAVKSRSGIPCVPQLINVESSNGAEELGICRVNNNGVEGSVIVSRETDGSAEIINKPLVGYRQSDGRIIVGYQRSDVPTDVGQVMVIYSDGSSEYVYANGLKVEFDAKETSGAELLVNLIGKLIEPGGVAIAAEIDTPTPTATVTATAIPATPTKDAPTPVPATEVPAQAWSPKTAAEYEAMIKDDGVKLVNWNGTLNAYAHLAYSSSDTFFDGLRVDMNEISGLTLLDYNRGAGVNDALDLVFSYLYAGKNNIILVRHNPCRPEKALASPYRPSKLEIGKVYYINLITARSVDHDVVSSTIGGDDACQMYANLEPVNTSTLRAELAKWSVLGYDLRQKAVVYGVGLVK